MKHPSNMSDDEIIRELKFLDSLNKISVDNLLDGSFQIDMDENLTLTARGELFDTTNHGIISTIVDEVYLERVEVRKKEKIAKIALENGEGDKKELEKNVIQLYNEQLGIKILINSLYGAFSNQYFRFYDERIAESITLTGQLTIKWIEKELNKFFNDLLKTDNIDYIFMMDTDSCYINFDEFVRQNSNASMSKNAIVDMIHKFDIEKIQPLMEETYSRLSKKLGAKRQEMVMKREDIADKAIVTGKKRYIMQVLDSEGVRYKEPKIKIKGIECVKSSTPMVCRNMIKDSIKIILNEDEKTVQDYIQECYEKFCKHDIVDISFPRGTTNLEKYMSNTNMYRKATPIHVRSAILYNHFLDEYKLDKKYQKIKSGDKIKFIYLKVPNTIRENIIGFIDVLPDEFNLHNYIDYELQFEKAFVAPVQTILDTSGWSWKYKPPVNTLDEFFN
jgi:DNA polymerase elongation subunit (family B)